jgi:hypothetical protein
MTSASSPITSTWKPTINKTADAMSDWSLP